MPSPKYLKMNSKDLIYFIGMCLTIDKYPDNLSKVKNQIKEGSIDWEKFVGLCSNHLVTPAIYLKFKSTDLLALLPDELTFYLEEIYELNLSRNQMILAQINEISDLLAKNQIYPILLKGAGNLIDKIYSDPAERIMGDIDFLVNESEYLQAAEILTNMDYSASKMYYYDDATLLKHYPRLVHPDRFASTEVHRLPTDESHTRWLDQEMIRSKMEKSAGYPNCYILSDAHKVILNFIHCQLTNKGHKTGVVSLRDAYDLYLMAERVSLDEVARKNLPTKKISGYFLLSQQLLGVNFGLTSKPNFSNRWLLYKHDLNFKNRTFYIFNKVSIELIDRITRYTGLLFKSIYSKKTRRYIATRLSNSWWYKSQVDSWKRMFRFKN